jgi:cellulose synthase/poly-beta-1,6-N-acetylglucosamine synthase-like glycosyltransferase
MAPMFLLTLIGCFLFTVYGALIHYYRRAWRSIPTFTPSPASIKTCKTRISVLVPARNEAANIAGCIESLSRQSYPKDLYQIIVIDDHSTDATSEIVRNLSLPDLSLTCLRLAEEAAAQTVKAHKKFAIETGIRAATGELIVTTDADCQFHPDWLTTLAAFFEESSAKFIAAPVRIAAPVLIAAPVRIGEATTPKHRSFPARRSFLTIFQTLDFITLQGITGAAVYKKFHSMCNGANLAYEKKAFYEVGGFKGIDSIPSGDDMLLMHKIYSKYPAGVFFLKSRQAIVTTKPETSWSNFINQRIRWASKADHYDDKRIFWVLLLVYIVNAFFAAMAILACWNGWWLWPLLIGLTVKTVVEYPFVSAVASFFGQRPLMAYYPFLQPFHIFYTIVIGWLGKFGSYRWKDRKISK